MKNEDVWSKIANNVICRAITGQFMEFEFSKTFLLNSEKPKAASPNRESLKAEFSIIVPGKPESRIQFSERRIHDSGC